MDKIERINAHISCITTPYKDIFTTLCIVKTDEGALLFDTASFPEDIGKYVLPFLKAEGVGEGELKYVFISHNHTDHAGGLKTLMEHFPNACIVSGSESLRDSMPGYTFLDPEEGETLLGVLRAVRIPGHTLDSAAILDTRTQTLLSGDCLQLFGIYGSGKWGANIRYPAEHAAALGRLRKMDIENILAAHDYHPYGRQYRGKEAVGAALDACMEPLMKIARLIVENPELNDEEISEKYNAEGLPTLGAHVAAAVRGTLSTFMF